MSTWVWILTSGIAMSAIALTGSITLVIPTETFKKLVLPLVALAAGSLLGGALFHMLPESIDALGNDLTLWAWVAAGLFTFFVLVLVPFAAGNFVYIALTDLLPEITTSPTTREKGMLTTGFAAGLLLLFCAAAVMN